MAEDNGKWMQAVREGMKRKGTVGKFTRMAKARGKSTQEFAREEYHAPGRLGEEARFAANRGK
jgi:hypothetical protein